MLPEKENMTEVQTISVSSIKRTRPTEPL